MSLTTLKAPARDRSLSDQDHGQELLRRCYYDLRHNFYCKFTCEETLENLRIWHAILAKTTAAAISIPEGFEGVFKETEKYRPDVMHYKSQIYMWVLFCVPCILWDMIFHFLWDLLDSILGYFSGHYQALADKHVTAVNVHHEE